MALNIDDLLRQVLSTVRDKQDLETSPYKRAERDRLLKMYPDPEKTHELSLQTLKNTGDTDVQTLRNQGGLAVANANETGVLARQGLINEGQANVQTLRNTGDLARQESTNIGGRDVANINVGGHKYMADALVEGHKVQAKSAVDVAEIGAGTANKDPMSNLIDTAVKADPDIAVDPKRWTNLITNARALRATAPTPDSIREFDKPSSSRSSLLDPIPIPASTTVSESIRPDTSPLSRPGALPLFEHEQIPASQSIISKPVYSFEQEYKKKKRQQYESGLPVGPRPGSRSTL